MNAAVASTPALLKKYRLEPAPESVARLGQLVAQRTADNMDQIARVVAGDPALKARLLQAASPRHGDPIEDVEQAIFRCGVEAVLVLAMADPLLRAVRRTAETLLGIALEQVDETLVGPIDDDGYLATVGFAGRANGQVFIRMRRNFARRIAAMLLAADAETLADAEITDAVGEVGNTIVGNFKSNLCDAGLSCKLSVPRVGPSSEFALPEVGPGRRQSYAFRHDGLSLLINILVESTD